VIFVFSYFINQKPIKIMIKHFLTIGAVVLLSCTACNNDAGSDTKTETRSDTTTSTDKKADNIDATQVPEVVKNAFAAKYAAATDVKWETATEDGKSTYKVKWKEGETKKKAEFGADGSFIKEDKD
jgi:hypothetical protein